MTVSRRAMLSMTVAGLASTPARAATFPSRIIKIIVPYPAAGPTDALARIIASEMQGLLGQSAIVENKPGASGLIGTRDGVRADPDGHTLVLGTNQTHATNWVLMKDIGYDPVVDFACIAGLADLQHVLVVSSALGVSSVAELIARAKAKPGALNYGSTGSGSGSHLAMELFKVRTGIEAQHIPFRGAAPMVQEIVGGRIDLAFSTVPSVIGQLDGATMRAIALGSATPSPRLPKVPLLRDQGVADAEADAWLALFAPAKTPADVQATLAKAVLEIMARPAVVEATTRQGFTPNLRPPVEMARFLAAEIAKWAAVARSANVTIDG